MLISEPTRYGAGITIFGDYWDLKSMYETIHDLCNGSALIKNSKEFVLRLAYEIRHAYQRDREEAFFGYDKYDRVKYRGVKLLWPIILFQIALLRWSAAFQQTNKEQQANLFRIEFCAENALIEYDASVGQDCIKWMQTFFGIPDNYLFLFVSEACYRFIFSGAAGKTRFKKLPSVLYSLDTRSKEYNDFNILIESIAKEKGRTPHEITDMGDWPKFKW
jgi:hypothetical protein